MMAVQSCHPACLPVGAIGHRINTGDSQPESKHWSKGVCRSSLKEVCNCAGMMVLRNALKQEYTGLTVIGAAENTTGENAQV